MNGGRWKQLCNIICTCMKKGEMKYMQTCLTDSAHSLQIEALTCLTDSAHCVQMDRRTLA